MNTPYRPIDKSIWMPNTQKKWLNGLESHLLVVAKIAEGNTYNNPKFVFQKVNMLHINLILNYYF
ncbi:MAG: hypothetical protein P8O07_05145 [Crocinitomicaceae bacterium]|nr:hypothetical protein [Crocinitomicaceae bacterium]